MTRLAGDSPYYEFALMSGGRALKEHRIKLPSVTTILNVIDKPALVNWAFKLGLTAGQEVIAHDPTNALVSYPQLREAAKARKLTPQQQRDEGGEFGTDVHDYLHQAADAISLGKTLPEGSSQDHQGVGKFLISRRLHPLQWEVPVWSLRHGYAGQFDWYYEVDGRYGLLDLKRTKYIYWSHWLQLAAYAEALRDRGYHVDELTVLRVRDGDQESQTRLATQELFELFLAAKTLWEGREREEKEWLKK